MEQLVAVILLNVAVLYALHLSLYGRWGALLAGAALPAAGAVLLYPLVIEQDLPSLRELLHGREAMLTLAVLLSAESLVGLVAIGGRLRKRFGERVGTVQRALGHFPGVGVLLTVLAVEALAFHTISGRDFGAIALGCAAAALTVLVALPLLLRLLVAEWVLRLELRLFLLLVQIGLAVVLTGLVSSVPVASTVAAGSPAGLGALIIAAVIVGAAGFFRYHLMTGKALAVRSASGVAEALDESELIPSS